MLIFPDIRVLGTTPKGGEATTVYGGKAPVPSADMLVAGTSCKDFSGLKGRDRKSIEALGTSGQTFFGFTELLLEQVCTLPISPAVSPYHHGHYGVPSPSPQPSMAFLDLRFAISRDRL